MMTAPQPIWAVAGPEPRGAKPFHLRPQRFYDLLHLLDLGHEAQDDLSSSQVDAHVLDKGLDAPDLLDVPQRVEPDVATRAGRPQESVRS